MTDSARTTMWLFGKGFAVLLSAAALFSIGTSVGVKRGQIEANTENIHILQQGLAAEINSRTSSDAGIAASTLTVSVKLEDIIRRLDRIERSIR